MTHASLISLGSLVVAIAAACGTSTTQTGFEGSSTGTSSGAGASSGAPGSSGTFGTGGNQDAAKPCSNLECQQAICPSSSETTITGTVYAPNGTLPIYNAIVYVPNTAVKPQSKGATCDKCGTVASGSPIVTTLSDASGKFKLERVPVGKNIPLVIQLGKWRRQIVVPEVTKCGETKLTDANLTRFPRNQTEGDMPKIAITTGQCDQLGCMLPKLGIDASEFGVDTDGDAKAIHVYESGGVFPKPGAATAKSFWSDVNKLKKYDVSVFSCECSESPMSKDAAAFQAVTEYLALGGRVFTTDFQYTWYKNSSDPALQSVSNITGNAPNGNNPMHLNDTFPKGKALAQWLQGAFPGSPYGQVTADAVFDNFKNPVDPKKAQIWATGSPGGTSGNARVFTVNTPVAAKPEEQCGKAVHIDAHVNGQDRFPTSCKSTLGQAEAMFAFFFFDLSSCIQKDDKPPVVPTR
jgi:hypothetical protein